VEVDNLSNSDSYSPQADEAIEDLPHGPISVTGLAMPTTALAYLADTDWEVLFVATISLEVVLDVVEMLLDAVAGTLIFTETSANRHAVTPLDNHDFVEAFSTHVASVELLMVSQSLDAVGIGSFMPPGWCCTAPPSKN
jgi:hypothetical protein